MQIDYQGIKQAVGIEKAARWLELDLKPDKGGTFRAPCPVCKRAGERAIIITPGIQRWYCHGMCKKGGDCIYLVGHIKGIKMPEAGKLLQDAFMRQPEPEKPKRKSERASRKAKAPARPQSSRRGDAPMEEDYNITQWLEQIAS